MNLTLLYYFLSNTLYKILFISTMKNKYTKYKLEFQVGLESTFALYDASLQRQESIANQSVTYLQQAQNNPAAIQKVKTWQETNQAATSGMVEVANNSRKGYTSLFSKIVSG